jgi:hypothetical protein
MCGSNISLLDEDREVAIQSTLPHAPNPLLPFIVNGKKSKP